MAITITPKPPWEQRTASGGATAACDVTWGPWARLASQGSALYNGEEFSRDPVTHQGNHIDALPYYCSKQQLSSPSWDFLHTRTGGTFGCPRSQYKGNGGTRSAVTPADIALSSAYLPSREEQEFCDRLAILKAKAALRRADASIPMLFRERIATLNMLKSYSGRSLDLIRRRQLADVQRFKRLTRQSSKEGKKFLAQSIANEHLMFVFGMLPLISDMEGLARFVVEDVHTHITGRGRMTRIKETKTTTPASASTYGLSDRTTRVGRYSARVSLRADIEVQMLNDMQRLGFNPLYTLYDFTPLSFVTGWFSNFNYWIQSLDPLVGSKYRTGSLTTRRELRVTREVFGLPGANFSTTGNGTGKGSNWTQVRTPIASEPPTGGLELYNNLSFFSVTAGISLFLQRKIKLANTAISTRPFRYRSSRPITLPPITYRR